MDNSNFDQLKYRHVKPRKRQNGLLFAVYVLFYFTVVLYTIFHLSQIDLCPLFYGIQCF